VQSYFLNHYEIPNKWLSPDGSTSFSKDIRIESFSVDFIHFRSRIGLCIFYLYIEKVITEIMFSP